MTSDDRPDQALVAAINAGGDGAVAAFETLYRRYRDWAVGLAWRFTGDRDAALDVMQDAFLYVLGKFESAQDDNPFVLTGQFKTFLYPVVRHLSLNARQKARRLPLYDDHDADAIAARETPSAAELPSAIGGDEELRAAMAILPAGQREVLILRFVDDLSLQEIAEALGLPLGTVKSRLHNALATLRVDPRTKNLLRE